MKEKSLILFTLLAQAAAGAFWTLFAVLAWAGYRYETADTAPFTANSSLLFTVFIVSALFISLLHLGAPLAAWRALQNLPAAWLSREILCAVVFAAGAGLYTALPRLGPANWPPAGGVAPVLAAFTALAGVALVYAMAQVYRLRTVPAWDTWLTPVSFFVTALLLGALAVGAILLFSPETAGWRAPALQAIALWAAVMLAVQLVLLPVWLSHLAGSEAARASFERLTEKNARALRLRTGTAVAALVVLGITLIVWNNAMTLRVILGLWLAFALALASETLGRVLFYAARVRHGI